MGKRTTKKHPKVVGVSHAEIMAQELKDPEFRYYYEQRRLVHEVALAIRGMRRQARMTQARLAKLVGVTQPMIAKIEKGTGSVTPRWDTLRKVCIALGKQMRLSFADVEEESVHLVEVDGRPAADLEAPANDV
jgi:DNA-binding XRE family transcriptional regulator